MSTQMQSSSKSLLGITADWHMVENDWSGRSQLGGDAEFGLYQVTKYAREQHLPLLAAGDLFSSRTPGRDMMIKTSSYLSGVDGYYIQGNHDKLYPSWMKLVARHWAHLEEQPVELVPEPKDLFAAARDERLILESEPLFTEDRTWHVYGLDYRITSELLQEGLDALEASIEPDTSVARLLVLHQGVSPFMPTSTSELADGMVPNCFDLVVVGHVHEAALASVRTKGGKNIPILSPGGLHLTAIDQNPNKKLYILYADGSIRSRPILTRAKMVVDFSKLAGEQVQKKVEEIAVALQNLKARPEVIKTPILHAIYDQKVSPDLEALLQESLQNRVHLFFKKQGEDAEDNVPDWNAVNEIDLKRHSEEGADYAKEIFHRVEPNPEIRSLVEAFLEREACANSYEIIKQKFMDHYHASNPQCPTGEFLPA